MGNSLKVMLVDDEVTILEGFKRLFDWKAYGCEIVCEAYDAVKLKLIREKQPAAEEKDNKPVFQLAAYLQQHLSEDITLQSLAEEFHMNQS
ncbi:hypothetical protein [Eisenbergiella sp.]